MYKTKAEFLAYEAGYKDGLGMKAGFQPRIFGKTLTQIYQLIAEDEERRNPIDYYQIWSDAHAQS